MKPLSLLLLSTLCAAAGAQAPLPTYQSLALDWTTNEPGVTTCVTSGAFVPGHPGRSAVALRGGALYWAFEPTIFPSIAAIPTPLAAGQTLVTVAALPSVDDGADRLAVVTSAGFDVWEYTAGAFVSCSGGTPLAGFVGATELRCGVHKVSGVEQNHVLAIGPNWVRGVVVLADDTTFAGAPTTIAGGQTLLDGAILQWVAGDLPEVAVLTTSGMFVFDVFANSVASTPFTCTVGKLCGTTTSGNRALCAVTDSGSDYILRTWQVGGTVTPSTTFPMPAPPVGIFSIDRDTGTQRDIGVSSTDSVLRCFRGGGAGPLGGADLHEVNIIDPAGLPANPTANDVRPVVDDVDYDGYLDIVFSHRATDQLLILNSVLPDFVTGALDEPDPGFAKSPMGQPTGLFSSPDANWAFPSAMQSVPHDAAGVRIRLPDWVTDEYVLRVVRYPVSDVDGKVDMSALGVYDYPLQTSYAQHDFDVLVPVEERAGLLTTQRVHEMLEFMIVGISNKKGDASPPALLDYWVIGGTSLADENQWDAAFAAYAGWNWGWPIGWPIDIGPDGDAWFNSANVPGVPPPVTDPGTGDPPIPTASRYIGVIVAVDIVLSDDLPSLPANAEITSSMLR